MIGAHPDDEDTYLIAWLSRGRHVSTAYLSLTRGDGGQNVIGNELGEALGVLRTEELLAARRIDGAQQFFTRAYDFGFSKDTGDTYAHWPKDTILGDVVRVVRAFRPHVIVAVFSGTARDGHGQHQVSGLLAREAYEVAGDTTRYSAAGFGAPWTPLKFYRVARGNAQAGTLGVNVGEYSALRGESYGEIAGRSRSQHKSQGFGALERKGPIMNYVRREATRVNETTPATSERSMFDGIDTTWTRLRETVTNPGLRTLLDSLPARFRAVRAAFDPVAPERVLEPLGRAYEHLLSICPPEVNPCLQVEQSPSDIRNLVIDPDLYASLQTARIRTLGAIRLAAGVALEAASAETWPLHTRMAVLSSIYNYTRDTVAVVEGSVTGGTRSVGPIRPRFIAPKEVLRDTVFGMMAEVTQPWWLAAGRVGAMFALPASSRPAGAAHGPVVEYRATLIDPARLTLTGLVAPIVFRFADDVKGEIRRPVAGVPAISITFDQHVQYAPANTAIDRQFEVTVRNANQRPDTARVLLRLPRGLTSDSTSRIVPFVRYDETRTLTFRVRGSLDPGTHAVSAVAVAGRDTFDLGYEIIDYDHIRRQRVYRRARVAVTALDVVVPSALRVAYVPGVSDNVAPALQQLGIPVTMIPASDVATADLTRFTAVVIGPRAYDANDDLLSANPQLLAFARGGGTLVVQYGQYEMTQPGAMPFPITINRPHDRVTHEDAPVTILDANARVLREPNRITQADFAGWVQERSLYMPRTFDERYTPVLAISDPGEPLNRGGILVARLGRGTYVYTTLAFFRQLPAGVPGAARLFVNLLSAGLPSSP